MDLLRAASAEKVPDTVGFPESHPGVPTKAHGWFLDTHKRVFDRVLNPETKIIIELGSWFGSSAKWFCENTNATIFAIDIWDDSFILRDEHYVDSNSKLSRLLRDHPLYPTFLANLWEHRDRLVPLRMKTVDGLQFLKSRGITPDVIYIDADHHYEPAREDISAALDLFPNAILVGDDYGNYEDVRRAVHECANKAGKTVHVDQNHCWTYKSIQSLTGVNIAPTLAEKKGFKGLMSRYKKMRGTGGDDRASNTAPLATVASSLCSIPTSGDNVAAHDIKEQTNDITTVQEGSDSQSGDRKRKLPDSAEISSQHSSA
mmetsp:Transcript_24972/g.42232  ORF Transcript_24972/g.42232 Transcript_24972/m.42232 type:complete len:316 (+) Transcript_24972:55-1002(+)